MSAPCTICHHKQREEIEKAAVSPGASIRAIASQYGVGRDALSRHIKSGHVTEKIQKAQLAQDIAEADDLLTEVQRIQDEQYAIFNAEKGKNNRIALEALRDQSKTIELKGKILGAFLKDKETKGTVVIKIEGEDADL